MIKLLTPRAKIDAFFTHAAEIIQQHITTALYELGEKYNNIIRSRGAEESWNDRSGDLRSSVGAGVYSKGKLLMRSTFDTILNGSRGAAKGKQMAEELASQYSDTYVLALFAAMDYAEKVEAIDGKDVLASAQIQIEREFKDVVKEAVDKAMVKIQKEADNL